MQPSTLVEISDVVGRPKVKMELPSPLRVGDRVHLAFQLHRTHGKRSEVLAVDGDFRVTSVAFEGPRQVLSVESTGKAPAWRAVKRVQARGLGPTRFPRTLVG